MPAIVDSVETILDSKFKLQGYGRREILEEITIIHLHVCCGLTLAGYQPPMKADHSPSPATVQRREDIRKVS